ncbi:Clr6 histone deacetylase complex subunit Pst2 [Schizosaccharomyces pombe]|uniref:Paired amphipathic helix protein pst2 n=1 Tax=Schizosaccharomyces pombe (strain 972 / ATCC 24843) TaxID=284812 RepID=PST2_SCHPO|nr:Clr6 histone deacetylase complex subunit Pst2 [Schizosaccharomyces pombe]O13919.1 RecName: Full=Paired amphipathic helix protein pst2; AltName: Full=SIN3 homolog 2 [Schizosaccharomyces pombe 972h-]8I02_A Chain A, Paired amphipathic helix protein pst2 [Schizosaccharomyces pombe]8IFG_A Chain A, Paired amphipathic helix protein pst2 [Schizosaccharomyces pombe 972h-]CAB11171.1 Clr6 histone deacetylase complex subunit Pst2 [Schizosaccharomyces pombe]|eukprot:NP_593646.1 Clr6 histone deacetylase complex subunit Pst2 [Schizosaccharomyces pombe]
MEQTLAILKNDNSTLVAEMQNQLVHDFSPNGTALPELDIKAFVQKLGQRLCHRPYVYSAFMDVVKALHNEIVDFPGFIERISVILRDYPDLLEYLNIFLPSSYKYLLSNSGANFTLQFTTPSGPVSTPSTYVATYNDLPCTYHRAIGFVSRVRRALLSNPEQFFKLQDSLRKFKNSECSLSELQTIVTSLLAEHPSLAHEFHNFLPSSIFFGSKPPLGSFPLRGIQSSQFTLSNISDLLSQSRPDNLSPFSHLSNESSDFFKNVKNVLTDVETYHEFLKLLNLYVQGIIDRNILVSRGFGFLKSNSGLWRSFLSLTSLSPEEFLSVYNSACSDFPECGPSYRLLPVEERNISCSGRDDFAWGILNDDWVSHPTWASEESGFIVQRKTPYEEAMTKLEEERYEFDRHIEATSWTIKSLKKIQNRINELPEEERETYTLEEGLGLPSKSIYKKTIKLVYTSEHAEEMFKALERMPCLTLPLVISRLEEKNEEWKSVKRSLQPGWRSIEFKNYDKSLDSQCVYFKARDKKNVSSKFLLAEADILRSQAKLHFPLRSRSAFEFSFVYDNEIVLFDTCYMVCTYIVCNSPSGLKKVEHFFKNILPLHFGLEKDKFSIFLDQVFRGPDYDVNAPNIVGNKPVRRKRSNSITQLTEFVKQPKINGQRESRSAAAARKKEESGNKSQSNSQNSLSDESGNVTPVSKKQLSQPAAAIKASLKYPSHPDSLLEHQDHAGDTENEMHDDVDKEQFGYSSMYVFFRLFNLLYERLYELQRLEDQVSIIQQRIIPNPVSQKQKIWRDRWNDLSDVPDEKTHYENTYVMILRLIYGIVDQSAFEDYLRFYYGNKAYKIYTIDKLVWSAAKQVHHIVSDGKYKFVTSLVEQNSSASPKKNYDDFLYRLEIEKLLNPDEILFRFCWINKFKSFGIKIMKRANLIVDQSLDTQRRVWKKYVQNYRIQKLTEEISYKNYRCPFLCRNIEKERTVEQLVSRLQTKLLRSAELVSGLQAKLCLDSFKLLYLPRTEDSYIDASYLRLRDTDFLDCQNKRKQRWRNRWESLLKSVRGTSDNTAEVNFDADINALFIP